MPRQANNTLHGTGHPVTIRARKRATVQKVHRTTVEISLADACFFQHLLLRQWIGGDSAPMRRLLDAIIAAQTNNQE
jgi:hypothetical protein